MWKAMLIKIGLQIFFEWLGKQEGRDSILVNNLINAHDINDLKNIVTDAGTEEAVAEMVTQAARKPIGNILDNVFGLVFRGLGEGSNIDSL